MSETTALDQRVRDWTAKQDEIAARRRGYLIGATGMLAFVVVVLLVVWPIIDRNLYLRDDRGLGNSVRGEIHPSSTLCGRIANGLYGRPMGYVDGSWAPRSEKAFVAGCTGVNYLPGGD